MPDLNSNATNRIPSRRGLETTEVFSIDDFPTPIGGLITLESKLYLYKNSVDIGINRFTAPAGVTAVMRNEFPFDTLTSSVASNALFDVQSTGLIDLETMVINLTGNNAEYVNTAPFSFFFNLNVDVNFTGTGISKIGNLTQCLASVIEGFNPAGYTQGLIVDGVQLGKLERITANVFVPGTGSDALITLTNTVGKLIIQEIIANTGPNESLLKIDANITASPSPDLTITDLVNIGTGTIFKTGVTGPYTAISNVGVTPNSVTSVSTGAGDAVFTVGAGLTLTDGMIIDHTAFTLQTSPTLDYNGENLEVFGVAGNTYKVKRPDGTTIQSNLTTDTGTATELLLEFTAASHNIPAGSGVVLLDNSNYNLAAKIFTQTAGAFRLQIRANNLTAQTGSFKTASLESDALIVDVINVNDLPDSTVRGGFFASSGTVTSGLVQGSFNDFVFPDNRKPFEDNEGIEYNVTPTNGEVKIISLKQKQKIIVPLSITLDPSGGSNTNSSIFIKLLINRNDGLGYVELNDDIITEVFFRGTNVTANINREINANPDDKVKFVGEVSATTVVDYTVIQADIMI